MLPDLSHEQHTETQHTSAFSTTGRLNETLQIFMNEMKINPAVQLCCLNPFKKMNGC